MPVNGKRRRKVRTFPFFFSAPSSTVCMVPLIAHTFIHFRMECSGATKPQHIVGYNLFYFCNPFLQGAGRKQHLESAKGTRYRLHSKCFKSPWKDPNANFPKNAIPRPRHRISLHFPESQERSVWKQHSRNRKFAIPGLGARARKRHETPENQISCLRETP